MKRLRNQRGLTSYVSMLIAIGGVVGAYVGAHYAPLFLHDMDVKHAMREAAAKAYTEPDDGKVIERLKRAISRIGGHEVPQEGGGTKFEGVIDMSTTEIQFERKPHEHIEIWVNYVRPIDWMFIRRRTWVRYNKYVKGDLSPVDWGKSGEQE